MAAADEQANLPMQNEHKVNKPGAYRLTVGPLWYASYEQR